MLYSYTDTILRGWPKAEWTMTNNDLSQLNWISVDIPKPSIEEIIAKQQELQTNEAMRLLRIERLKRLQKTDVYMLADFPISTEQKTAWLQYRQALRDLPDKSSPILNADGTLDMNSVNWPVEPIN